MRPDTRSNPPRRFRTKPLVLSSGAVLLVLALVGCGRALAPSAPASHGAGLGTSASSIEMIDAEAANGYKSGVVVWWGYDTGDEPEVEHDHALQRVDALDGAIICALPPGSDPEIVAQQMRLDPRVRMAEPNYVVETAESRGHSWAFDDGHMDLSGYEDQTASQRLGLDAAHTVSQGSGVTVAILDTGVDPDHPLFAGRLLPGHDFVDGDADPRETPANLDTDGDGLVDESLGHGSHVAGIAVLVAPEAKILPLRVLDTNGRGDAVTVARGIYYAVSQGARVINLSLGMLVEDMLVKGAIARATAGGAVVVASAGNWGAEYPLEYPANFRGITLAVAATNPENLPASFTSYGGFVALTAPGETIRSAYWNGHTAVWSGTSMSAPFVSGAAALLLSLHPDWGRTQVLDRLAQTARPFGPMVQEASEHFGAGMLDLAAALAPDGPLGGASGDPVGARAGVR